MKATRIAAAVLTALALPAAPPAAASDGTLTYMLCANPDTGRGTVAQDGSFPDGVSMQTDQVNMSTLQSAQQCSGQVDGSRGMIMRTNGSYRIGQSGGATFRFDAPSELSFLGASLYRRVNTDRGLVSAFNRSSSDWIYASPNWDFCEDYGFNCKGRGGWDPFAGGNHVAVGTASDGLANGFKWYLRCSVSFCDVTGDQQFVVYGGKVALGDDSPPNATIGVGSLSTDSVLSGVAKTTFSASDGESGVYRARVVVDDVPRPWFVVDGGNAGCRDVNFANGDDYEFGRSRPCPARASGVAELNTTTLADGEHSIELEVEDATGRRARPMDRVVEIDNVPAPSVASSAGITGDAVDGATLEAAPGSWDDHGAAGDPVVTARWERCVESGCSDRGSAADPLDLDDADVGSRIRVVETAVNSEGSAVARSSFTDVVADTPAPSNVSAPTISGNPRRGNLLVANAGGWDVHGSADEPELTRQWQRCRSTGSECVDVAGATGSTYELGDADLNRRLRVVETASNEEGSASVSSAPAARVTREDGTLPPDNNGEDDDGDGTVDEPGETAPVTPPGGGGTGTNGANGTPGTPGTHGTSGTSTTSSVTVSRSTKLVAPNGTGASSSARLVAGWRDARGTALTVGYGKGAVAVGRVVDETGRGIAGAVVEVSAVTSMRGAVAAARPSVTAGEDGRFTYAVGRSASSETIRFSYAHERGGAPVAIDELELRVTASVKLSVKLRGVAVTYKGTVAGRPIPRGGKLVVVQGRVKGKTWQTFATRRARSSGRFSGKYRLKLRVPGRKLQFRARVLAESGYPFLPAVSRAVTKTVR